MIQVKDLTKIYGSVSAVNKVSFELEAGATLALVGTSGSGKTTTLKLINRLIEPTAGEIYVNGENVFQLPPEQMRRRMGYVIQNIGLFPHYTIAENIAIVPKLLGWDAKKTQDRSYFLLERLKLDPNEVAHKYPSQLSGGQRQRVGIARALAANPPIILMDEPFGALDPITRHTIQQDFLNLDELASKTSIIVTHDVEEAFTLGNMICVLDKGEIQQLGTPEELLFRPANNFVKDFLADKKLDLQFKLFQVKDVFELLPEKALPINGGPKFELPVSYSIREAIDVLSEKKHGAHLGFVELQDTRKEINLKELMDSFHRFIDKEVV